jgi:hypothetical protein
MNAFLQPFGTLEMDPGGGGNSTMMGIPPYWQFRGGGGNSVALGVSWC